VVTLSSLILSAPLGGAYEGVAAAIALHSNAGPAFAALTRPDAVTDLMTSPIFAVTACAAMIFGRLETAAALPMIGFLINRLRG
jgi:hypothetical protein